MENHIILAVFFTNFPKVFLHIYSTY